MRNESIAVAGLVLGLMSASAMSALTGLNMSMKAESTACVDNCTLNSSYTVSNDTDAAAFGTFADLAVTTGVTNPFAASANGSVTLTSNTGFTVQFNTSRPAVGFESISYSTRSSLDFFFKTDAAGGSFKVSYQVNYARPGTGVFLDVGLGFPSPTPFLFSLNNSKSVEVPFDSSGGTRNGVWTATLDPNTSYGVQLAAGNTRSIFNAGGVPADTLGVTFDVSLPAFAQAVPEPAEWALMFAGLAMIGAVAARRRNRGC